MKKVFIVTSALFIFSSLHCMIQKEPCVSPGTPISLATWLDHNKDRAAFVTPAAKENCYYVLDELFMQKCNKELSDEDRAKKIMCTLLSESRVIHNDKGLYVIVDYKTIIPYIQKYMIEGRRLQAIKNLTEPSNNFLKYSGLVASGALVGAALYATAHHYLTRKS